MKQIATLFTFLLFSYSAFAQQYYYLYQHQKVFLKPDNTVIYAEFENKDSMHLFLQKITDIENLKDDIQRISSKSLIFTVQSKGENTLLHRLSPAFSFSSPLLTHNQAKIMLVPQIIVQLKQGYEISTLLSQHKKYLSLKGKIGTNEYLLHVNTNTFERVLTLANKIAEKNDKVEWCEPNFYNSFHAATDPLYDEQYYLNNTGQNGGTPGIDINAPEAWSITKGSNTVRVAVIGFGVENHEDFSGRVLNGYTAGNPNGNGAPQNANIYNAKAHGEACAGIIAATQDNNLGIKGVDPTVQIVPVNIVPNFATPFNAGAATNAQVAQAINWAWHSNGGKADVLSCSWRDLLVSNAITTAIDSAENYGRGGKGSPVVFASGNDDAGVAYPGNVDGVITVGAIQNNGNIWNYSNTGSSMDLVAPSGDVNLTGDVVTTDRMGTLGYSSGNYTTLFGGTSAACPEVAGVICLMLSVNSGLDEYDVRNILQETAIDMGPGGFDNTYGYGRVNACEAVGEAFASSGIQGPVILCDNSATYTIPNTLSSAIIPTITWSATPSDNVSLSPNGNQVTVTKLDTGDVMLKASIATSCGVFFISQQIHLGVPDRPKAYDDPTVNEIRTINICPNLYQHLQIRNLIGILEWDWEKVSGSFHLLPAGQNAQVIGFTPSSGLITVRARNTCGWSVSDLILVNINDCNNLYNQSSIKIYPNPASHSVTVSGDKSGVYSKLKRNEKRTAAYIYAIKLYDNYGTVQLFRKYDQQQKVVIDVNSLDNGIYVIAVYTDSGVEYRKLVIQR